MDHFGLFSLVWKVSYVGGHLLFVDVTTVTCRLDRSVHSVGIVVAAFFVILYELCALNCKTCSSKAQL